MGIDVYLLWNRMTEEEKKAQIIKFDATKGRVGHLREEYHGSPYCTRVLVPEAFESVEARIPSKVMRRRLPRAIATIKRRYRRVYDETLTDRSPEVQSIIDFVELAERLEAEGKSPIVKAYL